MGDVELEAALSPDLGAVGILILCSDGTPVVVSEAGDVEAVAVIGDVARAEELEGDPPLLLD